MHYWLHGLRLRSDLAHRAVWRGSLHLLAACGALVLLAVLAVSCGSDEVEYPPSWPLASVSAPPGSKKNPLHFNVASDKLGGQGCWVDGAEVQPDRAHPKGGRFWACGFRCEEQWRIVENHFRAGLRSENLRISKVRPRQPDKHVYGISLDGRYEVGLFKLDQERYPDAWELRINAWDEPQAPGLTDWEDARTLGPMVLAAACPTLQPPGHNLL